MWKLKSIQFSQESNLRVIRPGQSILNHLQKVVETKEVFADWRKAPSSEEVLKIIPGNCRPDRLECHDGSPIGAHFWAR